MEKVENAPCMLIDQCVLRIQIEEGEEYLAQMLRNLCNSPGCTGITALFEVIYSSNVCKYVRCANACNSRSDEI